MLDKVRAASAKRKVIQEHFQSSKINWCTMRTDFIIIKL